MKLGVIFPQTEIGSDPGAVREFALTVEGLGYNHLLVYDHVLGADPRHYVGWNGPYTHQDMFHEPFVLFGFLAGLTEKIELVTGVVILPQRQTSLVAKQAAEVDVLTNGHLRLGVGIGWNKVEYDALGEAFENRGKRIEEQVELMRCLWTNPVVTFSGRWNQVTAAGLNPLPVQRPIPVWMGGGADPVIERIGRMADGWFPQFQPNSEGEEKLAKMRSFAAAAGRDPATIGVEGRVSTKEGTLDEWYSLIEGWQRLGATHVGINTMGSGFKSVDEHTEVLRQLKEGFKGC